MTKKELPPWHEIDEIVSLKLLGMYKDKVLTNEVDTYRKISRSLRQVFAYLMTEEEDAAKKKEVSYTGSLGPGRKYPLIND